MGIEGGIIFTMNNVYAKQIIITIDGGRNKRVRVYGWERINVNQVGCQCLLTNDGDGGG